MFSEGKEGKLSLTAATADPTVSRQGENIIIRLTLSALIYTLVMVQ